MVEICSHNPCGNYREADGDGPWGSSGKSQKCASLLGFSVEAYSLMNITY